MDVQKLSSKYQVRHLTPKDVDAVLALCSGNPQFYRYHPPVATQSSVLEDMQALPPGVAQKDKYYIGFYSGGSLLAIMDLIAGYPKPETAYIGLFMMNAEYQGKGAGSALIRECKSVLKAEGFTTLRLAIDEGNPQSRAFWEKNGLILTGQRVPNEHSAYLPMECRL